MKRKSFAIILALILIYPLNSAIAAKEKGFKYNDIVLDIVATGNNSIAFATHDQRPYILDGTRIPDFAGYLRNAVGMAYPTSTTSKQPLADVMSEVFSNSFKLKGFDTKVVKTKIEQTPEEVLDNCQKLNADLIVILTLKEWQSDGYGGYADIKYDFVLQVYDAEGVLIAEESDYTEKENMGFSKKKAWDYLKQETRKFFKAKMEDIFNSDEISNAMKI
ncbi:MAG: hypothetical protein KQH79_02775 [Bacteroidetes bacterium]|nr:hypothetical protein [Bacteroidota bacterium]